MIAEASARPLVDLQSIPGDSRVSRSSPVVSGMAFHIYRARLWARVAWLAFRQARTPRAALADLVRLVRTLSDFRAGRWLSKVVRMGPSVAFDLYSPPFPSPAFDRFVEGELQRLRPSDEAFTPLQVGFLAITKKCGLHCEHCFEWEAVNGPEALDLNTLKALLRRIRGLGATQVFLSGGEPLSRGPELVQLVASAPADLESWVITAGQGLHRALAKELKNAGLRGLVISLDHWDPERHDAFRGRIGTFGRAVDAAHIARESGLEIALSLCPTRVFLSREENLWRYAELALDLGAGFVQVVEPKAAGHFKNQDVELDEPALARLEVFYQASQFDPRSRDLPVFSMPDLMSRRLGCLGRGQRYLYMDTDGSIHACPFCRGDAGSILTEDLGVLVERLRFSACPAETCSLRAQEACTPHPRSLPQYLQTFAAALIVSAQ